LDNAQMVYDFGLMKQNMKAFIDCFDHAITIWDQDDDEYIKDMKNYSDRWIQLPVSPSAEQFSRVIFVMIDKILQLTQTVNGERDVKLNSIIVHETDTGYAQCFAEDAYSKNMGLIDLDTIIFSDAIKEDWSDKELWEKIKKGEMFVNPKSV
jgi:6-pyruvoyltetrahydropterin/6-carboxytetrahydropterin synthase